VKSEAGDHLSIEVDGGSVLGVAGVEVRARVHASFQYIQIEIP
jgi:hypothetical protein